MGVSVEEDLVKDEDEGVATDDQQKWQGIGIWTRGPILRFIFF